MSGDEVCQLRSRQRLQTKFCSQCGNSLNFPCQVSPVRKRVDKTFVGQLRTTEMGTGFANAITAASWVSKPGNPFSGEQVLVGSDGGSEK